MFLELNSPGSNVNIFTREAARQIVEIFGNLGEQDTQLVVFTSAKPYSFINGTQLVLAPSIKDFEDLVEITAPTRSAYKAIADSPLVTIAAIEGCCYGCGIEFTLGCDYRVASDSSDTKFYMTELPDYHFPPVFGGLEKLPRLLGFEGAVDLVLHGETWSAKRALQHGLIDRLFEAERFSDELSNYLDSLLETGINKRSSVVGATEKAVSETYRQRALATITRLPREQQLLHRGCFELMDDVLANRISGAFLNTKIGELFNRLPVDSWRNASTFFFFLTMARTASLGVSSIIPDRDVEIALSGPKTEPFQELLSKKKLQKLTIRETATIETMENGNADVSIRDPHTDSWCPVNVSWGYQDVSAHPERACLYFPEQEEGICEALLPNELSSTIRPFLSLLFHLGWEPLLNANGSASIVNRFINVYFTAIARLLDLGEKSQYINHVMLSFGFKYLPVDVNKRFLQARNLNWSEELVPGKEDFSLLRDLLLSLYNEGVESLEQGLLKHSSQVDLIMKMIFGFPVARGSFCEYVKKNLMKKR
ncbi:MAG: enoyl-CoA hydratase/isomerase family protein [Proteobacteria bacterium]|nr:enoyl-CoA hydratase/isomerase family protein [Pseudomonadota bacterium]